METTVKCATATDTPRQVDGRVSSGKSGSMRMIDKRCCGCPLLGVLEKMANNGGGDNQTVPDARCS